MTNTSPSSPTADISTVYLLEGAPYQQQQQRLDYLLLGIQSCHLYFCNKSMFTSLPYRYFSCSLEQNLYRKYHLCSQRINEKYCTYLMKVRINTTITTSITHCKLHSSISIAFQLSFMSYIYYYPLVF